LQGNYRGCRITLPTPRAACGNYGSTANSRNTIPGRVFFTVDFRHPDDAVLTEMDRALRQACAEIAAAIGLEVEVGEFWYFPPTPFDPDLVAAVRHAAAVQGCNRTSSAAPGTMPSTWRAWHPWP
jgi:beta-ureidopropionase / N-carbamoyl-L-amino-acid hydrolase